MMMWSLFLFVLITCNTDAQNNRILQLPSYDNGHGWDIRLAVPGKPGNDYPTLSSIPRTRFSCAGKDPGYYADVETNCQVFRVCTVGATYGFQSFLCPNGTLFNQAVFVCDWWMNVICNKSYELIRSRNEQFENLKLGPHLMKDVKKMLTHPVRNPVNTRSMKSKVIVMQNYKPPSGQLFPNEALLTPPERLPSHVYFPTKAIQTVLHPNDYRTANLAYSTLNPNPQYIPPTVKPTSVRNVEILQRQRLYDEKSQAEFTSIYDTSQKEKIISNSHTGQMPPQSKYSNIIDSFRNDQEIRQKYYDLRNRHKTQNANHIFEDNTQKDQHDSQNVHFFGNLNENTLRNSNSDMTTNINTSGQSKKQLPILIPTKLPTANSPKRQNYEGVSNGVSSDIVPPTILAKTIAYSRLVQEPKQTSPKSRITFKTWVLKPTRNPKLIENSSPYVNNQLNAIQIEGSDYEAPYNYNEPIESRTTENDLQTDLEGYNYPNPTISSFGSNSDNKGISGFYFTPTTLNSLNELFLTPTTPQPIETPRVLLDPITINSSARQYLPPTEASTTVSNQYLQPDSALRQFSRPENLQFITDPTSSKKEYSPINYDIKFSPRFSQQNYFEDNYNNLSFSDILSKEKLDITINEIVNDTNGILQTVSPGNFHQYIENFHSRSSPNIISDDASFKPAKLISIPSTELEPPIEDFNKYQSGNKISTLPFIHETSLPTIERTVSLKITIPESIANYLFKTHADAKLEILNTDGSNYLVLKDMRDKHLDDSLTYLSTSQALVFSHVADSINKAKKYNNIIQDNVITPTPSAIKQFQGVNNEELGHISKTISKLTASQYTSKSIRSNNINTDIYESKKNHTLNQDKNKETYTSNTQGNQTYLKYAQEKLARLASQDSYSTPKQNPSNTLNSIPQENSNKIYSGQFYKYPVPEVTRQIINSPNPANSNIIIQTDFDKAKTQRTVNSKNTLPKASDFNSNGKVDKPQNLSSARSQVVSSTERSQFSTRGSNVLVDDLLNVGSGITAQLQDKIVGTVLHPSDKNKFVTYKTGKSYYLQSELLNRGDVVSNRQIQKKNTQEVQSNSYPDLITFHFISSDNQKQIINDASQEKLQKYRLREINNFEENNKDISVLHSTFPTDITVASNVVNPQFTKQRQTVTRLYDGPSSYLAPQSSIGNLILMDRNENYKDKIEDLDENNNFNGYLKDRLSPEFNF